MTILITILRRQLARLRRKRLNRASQRTFYLQYFTPVTSTITELDLTPSFQTATRVT